MKKPPVLAGVLIDFPLAGNSGGGGGVGVQVDTISPVSLQGGLPGDDRTGLNRLSVPREGTIAVQGLIGARGAHASEFHAQRIGHRVLLSQAQDLVTGILEVSNTGQGDTPGLGGGQAQVEALGIRVIGDDFFRVGVGFQGSIGQTIETCNIIEAVHPERSARNGEDATSIRNGGARADHISVTGTKVDEASRAGSGTRRDTSKGGIHVGSSQGDDVNVVAKCG